MGTIQEAIQLVVDATPARDGAQQFEQALNKVAEAEKSTQQQTTVFEAALKRLGDREAYAGESMRKLAGGFGATAGSLRGLDAGIRSLGAIVATSAKEFRAYGDSVAATARRTAELEAASRRAQGAFGGTVSGLTRVAALFGAGLWIRSAIDSMASFERAIAQVGVISRSSSDELRAIRDQAANLGATTEKTATQAAEGALLLARAGFDAQKILGALPGTLKLSVAGALDLGEASEIAANSLAQFQINAAETNRVTNALLVTASGSNTDVRQLAEALRFAGSVAGSAGQDIESVAAALGVLGDRGIQGSLAGRALRGIFLDLRSPTVEARQELLRFGADLGKLDPRFNSLVDIADELSKVFRAGADAGRIFGAEQTAQAVILGQSATRIRELVQAQKEWQTATDDVAATLSNTLSGSIKSFQSALEGVVIRAGDEGLGGALKSVLDVATETVRKLGGLEQGIGKFGLESTVAASAVQAFGIALAISGGARFISFLGSTVTLLPRLVGNVIAATKAQLAFNAASAATPWGAIGVGISAIVVAGLAYSRRLDEIAHSQDAVAKSAKEFAAAMDGVQRTLARSQAQATVGPIDPNSAEGIRAQIKQVEGLRDAISQLRGTFIGQAPQSFPSEDAFQKKLKETADAITTLESRVGKFRSEDRRSGFREIPLFSNEDVAQLQALKTLRDNLTQQPISIRDVIVAPAGETLRSLFDAAGLATDFDALKAKAKELTGIDQPFVVVDDAISLLQEKIPQLAAKIEDLKNKYEGVTSTQKDFSRSIEVGVGTLAEEQKTLEDRLRVYAQVKAGALSLADAERIVNVEREVRQRTSTAIAAAEQVNGKLSDEARVAVEKQVRALVDGKAAADRWVESLKLVGGSTQDATADVQDMIRAIEQQARSMRTTKDPTEELAHILDELGKVTDRSGSKFAELANRATNATNDILHALSAQADAQKKIEDQQRGQQAQDRYADIVRGINQQKSAYLLTRDALDELVAVEEVRALKLGRQAEDRVKQMVEELNTLRQLREATDAFAGGIGDALTKLKEGGGGREAFAAFAQGAGDRLFNSQVQRLEEQISAGLSSAFASAFGVAGGSAIPGASPGEQGIIDAVRSVEAAVRQQTSQEAASGAGRGGASGTATAGVGGFDFGSFAGSLALAGLGVGLSLLFRRGGGSGGDQTPFEIAPFERRGSGTTYNQQRITQNNYVAPDRIRLASPQAASSRNDFWRRR